MGAYPSDQRLQAEKRFIYVPRRCEELTAVVYLQPFSLKYYLTSMISRVGMNLCMLCRSLRVNQKLVLPDAIGDYWLSHSQI